MRSVRRLGRFLALAHSTTESKWCTHRGPSASRNITTTRFRGSNHSTARSTSTCTWLCPTPQQATTLFNPTITLSTPTITLSVSVIAQSNRTFLCTLRHHRLCECEQCSVSAPTRCFGSHRASIAHSASGTCRVLLLRLLHALPILSCSLSSARSSPITFSYRYAISAAQYFGPAGAFDYGNATIPEVITAFHAGADANVEYTYDFVQLAKAYGLTTAGYESGPGCVCTLS
jgi:hypothetical protein